MPTIEFDRPLAVEIFHKLAHMWELREPPFDTMIPPEVKYHPSNIPKGGIEHALWILFAGFTQRFGQKADPTLKKAGKLIEKSPWMIDPRTAFDHTRAEFNPLRRVIPFAFLEKYEERVDWWISILKDLSENFDNDPRNILLSLELTGCRTKDRVVLIKKLTSFKGVGSKIAQLMLCWLQEAQWEQPCEKWQYICSIPTQAVDLWIMRLLYQFGVITDYESDQHTVLEPICSEFISQVCLEEGISHTNLVQAIWHIGSVVCGSERPLSDFRVFCSAYCPAFKWCRGIVPANYITNGRLLKIPTSDGRKKKTARTGSMMFRKMILHPPYLPGFLEDLNPNGKCRSFSERPKRLVATTADTDTPQPRAPTIPGILRRN